MPSLTTPRLELVPATAALLRLEIGDLLALGRALKCTIPAAWPPEEVVHALPIFEARIAADPAGTPWVPYFWIRAAEADWARVLVGCGGFTRGLQGGAVELGYGTLSEYQGQGYGTEAVSALTKWAAAQPEVSSIFADALPANAASVRPLIKSGFVESGPGAEAGLIRFRYLPIV